VDADERPASPGLAVHGRLEQECARPVGGKLAVDTDRGFAVGEETAYNGDDPAAFG
jgi:hypothetical protein